MGTLQLGGGSDVLPPWKQAGFLTEADYGGGGGGVAQSDREQQLIGITQVKETLTTRCLACISFSRVEMQFWREA